MELLPKEPVSIDALILANHVETLNNQVYISGGGWTDMFRPRQPGGPPPPSHFGIAVCLTVPWHEANEEHKLTILIEDDDALTMIMKAEAPKVRVGIPATLPNGASQYVMIGFSLDTVFPHTGGYRVVVKLDEGKQIKTWSFRVHDVIAPMQRMAS